MEKRTRRSTKPKQVSIRAFTEHALSQIDAVIPTIGYVPPAKRPRARHILIVSSKAETEIAPNVERIAHADPIGFIAALIHGQPVQVHTIAKDGTESSEWVTPSLVLRADLAKYFADKLIPYMTRTRAADVEKPRKQSDGDDNMFARAADGEV